MLGILKKAWWLVPLAGLAVWVLFLRGEVRLTEAVIAQKSAQISTLNGKIALQNAQVAQIKAAGEAAVAAAKAKVVERVKVEKQVQVKWQTRYVPVATPTDCAGAVAAGAVNGAQIGRLYMEGSP